MAFFWTSTAICSATFLAGVLCTGLLFDHSILWPGAGGVTDEAIRTVEGYYLTWWNGPTFVKSLLNVVYVVCLWSLTVKFARKSEASFYFSGASLLLLISTAILFMTTTLPNLRAMAKDPIVPSSIPFVPNSDTVAKLQAFFRGAGMAKVTEELAAEELKEAMKGPMTRSERILNLSILCASNTLVILLLAGVVVLQIGEWYVEATIVAQESRPYPPTPTSKADPAAAATKKTQ